MQVPHVHDPNRTGSRAITVFTSRMFMHGGWLHLGGNMLYLWIFGDNVEDRFGHAKFALFYLLYGIGATVAQVLVSAGSSIPNLGASGAIAGVLGAYLIYSRKGRLRY
jgi:membrane associated rhomboid family serine protease